MLKLPPTPLSRTAACLLATLPFTAEAWQPGSPASTGFTVDTHNRNDVIAFWHAVYQASEGYENRINWTGNYTGANGTTSAAFVSDVERRINYFRAMCGVPANVRVNTGSTVFIESTDDHKPPSSTTKSEAAQAAALMLIRNFNSSTGKDPAITHDPANSLIGWSAAAWNANAHGNLAFGLYGPSAVTEYLVEELASGSATSSWNTLVGHRRWCLFPPATDFATGDQPGSSVARPPTNVLYISQRPGELVPDPTPGFVAYPAPGYFPAAINSRYWSLSHAGADFDSASVQMTDASGKPVAVSSIKRSSNFGDPAIVWEVGGAAASKSVYSDSKFNVVVSGIGGTGVPASFNYSVTLIHPDRIASNQSISGPGSAVSTQTTAYTIVPAAEAEAQQVTAFLKRPGTWKETAEKSPKARVIDGTAASYPLQAKMTAAGGFGVISGRKAFHLTFPTSYDLLLRGVPEQWFEIDRQIIAKSKAQIRFLYRRGYMTKGSSLAVEYSSNGGLTWKRAGKTITGVSDSMFDAKISSAAISLPKSANPIRIRFRYYTKPGEPIYTHEASPTSPTGIYIDDITTKNCDWLEPRKTTPLAATATQFAFNASSAGGSLVDGSQWRLGLRTMLGGKWFPYGPLKSVRIKAP